jgi:hypothetical protein
VQGELDGAAALLGAAADLAVAIHPGVGAFHDPAFAGLDGGGDAFAGDLVDVAEFVEQVPGRPGVIAAVQVHTRLVGQRPDHVRDLAHSGFEQR